MRPRNQLAIAASCLLAVASVAQISGESQAQAQTATRCKQSPVEPCTVKHGRLSTQNGITQTIWLIGTTRRVNVTNDLTDFLPPHVLRYTEMTSPDHSYIFGDFTICPIEPDLPGHMRGVCVTAASNLVVQNIDNSRPPFRIRSTWPPTAAGRGRNSAKRNPRSRRDGAS
jgi:hypothetical protein